MHEISANQIYKYDVLALSFSNATFEIIENSKFKLNFVLADSRSQSTRRQHVTEPRSLT